MHVNYDVNVVWLFINECCKCDFIISDNHYTFDNNKSGIIKKKLVMTTRVMGNGMLNM